jgi:hypothetical protein
MSKGETLRRWAARPEVRRRRNTRRRELLAIRREREGRYIFQRGIQPTWAVVERLDEAGQVAWIGVKRLDEVRPDERILIGSSIGLPKGRACRLGAALAGQVGVVVSAATILRDLTAGEAMRRNRA